MRGVAAPDVNNECIDGRKPDPPRGVPPLGSVNLSRWRGGFSSLVNRLGGNLCVMDRQIDMRIPLGLIPIQIVTLG
jgi:hypothetical protein